MGNYETKGTVIYLDPIIKKQYTMEKYYKEIMIYHKIDLFKTDIYSLGLTLFRALTGLNIYGINNS